MILRQDPCCGFPAVDLSVVLQICVSPNRVYVEESIYEEFLEKVRMLVLLVLSLVLVLSIVLLLLLLTPLHSARPRLPSIRWAPATTMMARTKCCR